MFEKIKKIDSNRYHTPNEYSQKRKKLPLNNKKNIINKNQNI